MRDSAIINIRKLYSALLYGTNVAGHTCIMHTHRETDIWHVWTYIHVYTYTQNACCGCCLHPLPAFPDSQFSDSVIWQLAVLDNAINVTTLRDLFFIIALFQALPKRLLLVIQSSSCYCSLNLQNSMGAFIFFFFAPRFLSRSVFPLLLLVSRNEHCVFFIRASPPSMLSYLFPRLSRCHRIYFLRLDGLISRRLTKR